jgi:putative pyruvate formate lyase activating enzyme
MKYGDAAVARRYSKVRDYVSVNRLALKEMHRQVGDLVVDDRGVVQRGLLVRHLVLPEDLAGTESVFRFLADEVSKNTYVNLMDQYRPHYRADEHLELHRTSTREEFEAALASARRHGITRLDGRAPRWRAW